MKNLLLNDLILTAIQAQIRTGTLGDMEISEDGSKLQFTHMDGTVVEVPLN